jgi:hypothetical protein
MRCGHYVKASKQMSSKMKQQGGEIDHRAPWKIFPAIKAKPIESKSCMVPPSAGPNATSEKFPAAAEKESEDNPTGTFHRCDVTCFSLIGHSHVNLLLLPVFFRCRVFSANLDAYECMPGSERHICKHVFSHDALTRLGLIKSRSVKIVQTFDVSESDLERPGREHFRKPSIHATH